MAKRIVKKKAKLNYLGLIYTTVLLTAGIFLFSQVFVRTENTKLMKSMQDLEKEIAIAEIDNEVLLGDIQDLREYSRVVSIAHEAGLETNNNTVTIKQGD